MVGKGGGCCWGMVPAWVWWRRDAGGCRRGGGVVWGCVPGLLVFCAAQSAAGSAVAVRRTLRKWGCCCCHRRLPARTLCPTTCTCCTVASKHPPRALTLFPDQRCLCRVQITVMQHSLSRLALACIVLQRFVDDRGLVSTHRSWPSGWDTRAHRAGRCPHPPAPNVPYCGPP